MSDPANHLRPRARAATMSGCTPARWRRRICPCIAKCRPPGSHHQYRAL